MPIDERHPLGGEMSDVARGLFTRLQLPALERRYNSTLVLGAFAFVNGSISIGLMALAAAVTDEPLIFPPLGPTAFLLFYTPRAPVSSPKNTLVGHLIGAAAGYLALVVFGLTDKGPALIEGVTLARTGAAALSLGLTAGAMAWVKAPQSARGRDDPDREPRHPHRTIAACRVDVRRVLVGASGIGNQPTGGNRLPAVEPIEGLGPSRVTRWLPVLPAPRRVAAGV